MKIDLIEVKNYKSFKTLKLELKRINIILGPNNSGKSNILRFLLMLKQTFSSSLRSPLILNGNIIKMGSFRNITYMYNSNNIILKYLIDLEGKRDIYYSKRRMKKSELLKKLSKSKIECEIHYSFDKKQKKLFISNYKIVEDSTDKVIFEYNSKGKLIINNQLKDDYIKSFNDLKQSIMNELDTFFRLFNQSKPEIEKIYNQIKSREIFVPSEISLNRMSSFKEKIEDIKIAKFNIPVNLENFFPELYLMQYESKLHNYLNTFFNSFELIFNPIKFYKEFAPFYSLSKSKEIIKSYFAVIKEMFSTIMNISTFLRNYNTSFLNYFKNIYYLGPIRKYPKRYYPIISEIAGDVGIKGEFVPQLLKMIEQKNIYDELNKKISYWLKMFEMAKGVKIEGYEKITELISIICKEYFSDIEVNILDMGFGTSQILPIIIEGFLIPNNSLLIVEQPEIHLHPRAQAILGDLFIDITQANKKIIIETHSEHLFQRVQRRIGEGVISNEDVAFYYITMEKGGSKIQKLELDGNGYIKNIPDGFFDEDYKDASEHLMTTLTKKKI